MKKLFMLIMAIGFVGCGANEFISPSVQPILDEISQESCVNIEGVNAVLSDVIPHNKDTAVAHCLRGTTTIMFFLIDRFNLMQHTNKKALVLHELGHCLLGISSHNQKLGDDNYPESFMYSGIQSYMNEYAWENKKNDYYKLFYNIAQHQGKTIKDCKPIFEE